MSLALDSVAPKQEDLQLDRGLAQSSDRGEQRMFTSTGLGGELLAATWATTAASQPTHRRRPSGRAEPLYCAVIEEHRSHRSPPRRPSYQGTSADASVWGSTARPPWRRPTDQTSTLESPATVRAGCSQVAAKDNTARPLNCLMNADPQAGPWMPRTQQLPKLGIVGVLKPCCITAIGLI
jgi:hypothetical protein